MKKGKSIKEILLFIIRIISLIVMIVCIIHILKWHKENTKNTEILSNINTFVEVEDTVEIEDVKVDQFKVDFENFRAQNNEMVAWLKVNGTSVEYPVVKTTNNDFYLTHSFDKSYNSAGWIFADYKNKLDGTDKNIVIYGHNRRDGTMFASLKNILKEEWYNNPENQYITLTTVDKNEIYQVFSIYQTEVEDYYITTEFASDSEFEKLINTVKGRSIKEYETEVTKDDQILTLSTCANNNNYRVVLHAKKINN